jgi:leader peptidase (prepilin peptidase) / N-methyltransferase
VTTMVIAFGILGLCVGSFLNVVIWRVPQGLSIVKPGSACPSCHRELTPWENVPVLAWVALRAKCRTCKSPISWRYPAVELVAGLLFALIASFWKLGIAAVGCVVVAGLLALALVALDTKQFSARIALVTAALAVVTACVAFIADRTFH